MVDAGNQSTDAFFRNPLDLGGEQELAERADTRRRGRTQEPGSPGAGDKAARNLAELRQYFLDSAETLGNLGMTALGYLMEDAQIDEKWEVALKKRLRWVDGFMWTLDTAGGLVGVTRERMRQVQRKIEAQNLELLAPPRILFTVLELGEGVSNIEAFFRELRRSGLSGPEEDWSKDSLLELFSMVGNVDTTQALGRLFRGLSPPPPSKKIDSTIRKLRVKLFGIVDLSGAALATGLTNTEVVLILERMFKTVYANAEIALALSRPPAAFVESVARQLIVNPDATAGELHEGVRRQMSYRGVTQELSLEHFSQLLALVFGRPAHIKNLPEDWASRIELGAYETVLVDAFISSGRGTLHRDELVEAAVSLGLNGTTAGVYLSTSAIIRPSRVKRGYFQLV